MTELAHAELRFRNMPTDELIALVRRSAAARFGNTALHALEELIRRHEALELTRKRTPALVRQQED